MSWTLPRTWRVGEIVTKAIMDLHVKDNLRYLKGLDGVPTIQSGLIIDNTDGDEYLKLPLLSTAEAATVLNVAGEVAYDEATNRIKMYGATLNSVVTTADVDDTPVNGATTDPVSSNWAYDFINTLTTQADIPYATAAGIWARLAKGTGGQYLTMNAGATAPEWSSAAPVPQYGIIIWTGTIANIPGGYVICDGNNSSPNLLTRFIEGVATAATDPGTTGGGTSKTTAGHVHTNPTTSAPSATIGSGLSGGADAATGAHTHTQGNVGSQTDSIADIRPLFYAVAYIMKS